MSTDLTVVGGFDGVGGFQIAFNRAGARTVATIEIDKAAQGVLKQHWPDAAHFNDITEVTADELRAAGFVPERGIFTAGFPCQDLSVAGRRAGMGEGTRSGLFWHIDRLLAELAPAWVVLENVPGLLSSTCPCRGDGSCEMDNGRPFRCPRDGLHTVPGGACVGGCIAAHGGTMGAVLGALGHRGYGFAYRVLDAQHFGVPQRRRRVFIVGRLGDDGRAPAQILAEFDGSAGNSAPSPQAWARLAPAAREGARGASRVVGALLANGGDNHFNDADAGKLIASTLQAAGGERGYRVDAEAAAGGHLQVMGFSHNALDDEQAADELAPTIKASRGGPSVATFRKAGRAQTNTDDESWTEDDKANTVNTFDVGDTRATELVVEQTTATGDLAHALTAEGHDASEDGTGRGTPIVAATLTSGSHAPNVSAPGRRQEDDENLVVADTLRTHPRPGSNSDGAIIAPTLVARYGKGTGSDADDAMVVSPTVTSKWAKGSGGPAGDETQNLTPAGTTTVRRLTPLECERLQGFPDGHTEISNGKPQADSARYKQMGNSLAVPVAEWIAHRLVAVDKAVRDEG